MLNNIGLPGLLLIAVVVLVLFGRGKVSSLMGEVGKGITAFKRGVNDGEEEVRAASAEARLSADRSLDRTADEVQAAADRARVRADESLRDVTPRDTTPRS
ncbi:twin-arginine translocase TatA/TatE family subunit [Paracoccus sp. Z118]|uniref:twin-arginine translocase TatA/TatE family subunit n=1 Tax=Paracoccus sp. Z118 TaxID=2851017 RepID=UPI001C2C6EA8|nr:twin-arginine translocase TatA/TatE family subunit [Paracoccus sp. Z118]MBV0890555.1 twin-arginine translocase TatA/TatE family subunit [Paracoccus sp. Z118]